MDLLEVHARALAEFGGRVHAVGEGQWSDPTPCTEWNVRDLVGHLVYEQLWVPPLLAGESVLEVGDRFDGDQLGDDPVGVWDATSRTARDAFAAPGALDRTVSLSYGERPAPDYLLEMVSDLVVHAWDLARAIGADDRLDPELVELVHERTLPNVESMTRSGLFDPPARVPDGADRQAELVALYGREPT